MVKGVAVVWMPAEDFDRAVGFYEGTLGLEVTMREDGWAELDANGLTIGINGRESAGAGTEGGPVVTFRPEGGLDATVAALKDKGVAFPAEASEHPWGRLATFKDSEGNNLQLYEPPKR